MHCTHEYWCLSNHAKRAKQNNQYKCKMLSTQVSEIESNIHQVGRICQPSEMQHFHLMDIPIQFSAQVLLGVYV